MGLVIRISHGTVIRPVNVAGVRILVARCEIAYHGRAVTRLGAGDRVILFKDDGSLCVHAERGDKPLNYNLIKAPQMRMASLYGRRTERKVPCGSNVRFEPTHRS
jgi:hypothetical protein